MLNVFIPEREYYDGVTETFITTPARSLVLEHSLVAISKWESKWMKPFLGKNSKTNEEIYDYIRCMIIGDDCDMFTLRNMPQTELDKITNYIQSSSTATTITQSKDSKPSREIITSELIYYWMVAFNIPFECQHWHLNRLLTLVNICNIKNSPPKKQSPRETLSRNAALNAARKKAMKTSG